MADIRTPRSVKGAQSLCERFAAAEAQIEAIENARNEQIAAANALADKHLDPLIAERDRITGKLKPWWAEAGEALCEKDRKSIELGGCIIGTATGKASLDVPEKNAATLAKDALGKTKWGRELLRTTIGFDKRAIAKAIEGAKRQDLIDLGFNVVPAPELFVLKRAEQQRTRT